MKKITMVMVEASAEVTCIAHSAYVAEAALWMDMDADGNHVKIVPLHMLASIDLEYIEESN